MKKFAYLTIDDSPSSDWQIKLDFLQQKGIQAIWFCTGANLEKHPEFVRAAIDAGHVVANHSYSHPDFSMISLDEAEREIHRTHILIQSLIPEGNSHPRWFRFPYGKRGDTNASLSVTEQVSRREAIQLMLQERGYEVPDLRGISYEPIADYKALGAYDWFWTFDFQEWALDSEFEHYGLFSLEDLIRRMDTDYYSKVTDFVGLNQSTSDEIVLIHDHSHSTHLFQPLIGALLSKGVQFRPVPK